VRMQPVTVSACLPQAICMCRTGLPSSSLPIFQADNKDSPRFGFAVFHGPEISELTANCQGVSDDVSDDVAGRVHDKRS
jgi:hypothetical protein